VSTVLRRPVQRERARLHERQFSTERTQQGDSCTPVLIRARRNTLRPNVLHSLNGHVVPIMSEIMAHARRGKRFKSSLCVYSHKGTATGGRERRRVFSFSHSLQQRANQRDRDAPLHAMYLGYVSVCDKSGMKVIDPSLLWPHKRQARPDEERHAK